MQCYYASEQTYFELEWWCLLVLSHHSTSRISAIEISSLIGECSHACRDRAKKRLGRICPTPTVPIQRTGHAQVCDMQRIIIPSSHWSFDLNITWPSSSPAFHVSLEFASLPHTGQKWGGIVARRTFQEVHNCHRPAARWRAFAVDLEATC